MFDLSVKPVELLYKPLGDYQDELLRQGFCMKDVYDAYSEGEKERQSMRSVSDNYKMTFCMSFLLNHLRNIFVSLPEFHYFHLMPKVICNRSVGSIHQFAFEGMWLMYF